MIQASLHLHEKPWKSLTHLLRWSLHRQRQEMAGLGPVHAAAHRYLLCSTEAMHGIRLAPTCPPGAVMRMDQHRGGGGGRIRLFQGHARRSCAHAAQSMVPQNALNACAALCCAVLYRSLCAAGQVACPARRALVLAHPRLHAHLQRSAACKQGRADQFPFLHPLAAWRLPTSAPGSTCMHVCASLPQGLCMSQGGRCRRHVPYMCTCMEEGWGAGCGVQGAGRT